MGQRKTLWDRARAAFAAIAAAWNAFFDAILRETDEEWRLRQW
jgi:hypothetical protein